MKEITLFWSNICVLHRFEKAYLAETEKKLALKGIKLKVVHFGIGYPSRMKEHIEKTKEIPDLIVSTDLEVFEDKRVFSLFENELYDLSGVYRLKDEIKGSNICQYKKLLPFLVIPLVFVYNNSFNKKQALSLASIINESGVAFGGIGNSGAKSVIKILWSIFGKEKTAEFAKRSVISQMPVGAFHEVKKSGANICITPSLYARTADGKTLYREYGEGGAVAIPSYVAAIKRKDSQTGFDALKAVTDEILSKDFCDYFVSDGDLYCPLKESKDNAFVSKNGAKFLYPDSEWFKNTSSEEFNELYEDIIRAAAK
ncbi:MAG: hypothetical protein LBQ27_00320 [Clostridiales bacterium]|jgi:hypothetical protein|nr:hypothetical protein [Clostridiales bacterium]